LTLYILTAHEYVTAVYMVEADSPEEAEDKLNRGVYDYYRQTDNQLEDIVDIRVSN
jgi:hypothetical protein